MGKQKFYRCKLWKIGCIVFLIFFLLCGCSLFNIYGLLRGLSHNVKLYRAIDFQNFEAVKEAVDDGCNINSFKPIKVSVWDMSVVDSPIVMALFENRPDIAKYLIKQGADPNYITTSGKSVLTYLIEYYGYNKDMFDLLIEKGVDINYVNSEGVSLIEYAVGRYYGELIYALTDFDNLIVSDKTVNNVLNELKNDNNYYKGYGYLRALLKHNKNVDSQIYDSIFDSSRLLNEDIKEENKKLVVGCIASFGNADTLKKIIQYGDYDINYLYMLSCEYGNIENIQYLLSIGANINSSDKNGITAIERAMKDNRCDIVKYLLEKGASTRGEKGTNYDDILCYAAMNNNYDITKLLIEKYNDNLSIDRALDIAASSGNDLALKAFLDTGTDVNKPVNSVSLLELACIPDNGDACVKLLLDYGANVNGINGNPLINAVKYGNTNTVKLLIDYGVDINYNLRYSKDDVTALYYATTEGYYDITKELVKSGAKFSNQQEIEKAMSRIKLSNNIYNYLLENKLI